jgi:GT2 family glycosyltransferase
MKTRARGRAERVKPSSGNQLKVELAAWLSESDLVLLGSLPASLAVAVAKREPGPRDARFLAVPSRDGKTASDTTRLLIHWPLDGDQHAPASIPGVPPVKVGADEVASQTTSTQDFARDGLAWLAPETRREVIDFVVNATATRTRVPQRTSDRGAIFGVGRDVRLSATLHELREALRERLPVSISQDAPVALVDAVARVDRDAFFMRGRVGVGASRLARMTAVSPEGSRTELLGRAYWYDLLTPKVQADSHAWSGYTVFFTCAPSLRPSGWLVELETQSGELLEVGAPRAATQPAEVIRIILEDLAVEPLPATRLRTSQIVPAVRRLQRARRRAAALETVKQFGRPPQSPTVSVIVPLYRRIDLVEHQMTQFADDPGMQSADLIYVLDSPELKDELFGMARRLFPLYQQPFRVAVAKANAGFAGANNLGASIARGRLLLLLNSDVFPEAPGWLEAMVRFYDSIAKAGAVGPKLLYEDGTIQHAGMYFERLGDTQPWNNEHYFKGMHRDLPAATRSRPVAAVTGACLMVAKNLYTRLGGLSGDYVQGDFEDSELCLRLLDAGRQNWYFADVALYHLEAASYDPERRRVHDGFNRWLHSHLWGERLAALSTAATARVAAPKPREVSVVPVNGEVAVGAGSGS